jgi:hypothetical protein
MNLHSDRQVVALSVPTDHRHSVGQRTGDYDPDWCNSEPITAILNKERVATLNTSTSKRPTSPMSVGSIGEVK